MTDLLDAATEAEVLIDLLERSVEIPNECESGWSGDLCGSPLCQEIGCVADKRNRLRAALAARGVQRETE